jgi:endo-1,4-beta-xylanase
MGVLKILTNLKNKGIQVHALGLQSHLACHRPLAPKAFGEFLREVKGLGLEVIITELDVRNDKLQMDDAAKAQAAGNYVRHFLEMVQENVPVKTLVTWGLTTRYSWLMKQHKSAVLPLPLDEWYERTPVWQAIHDSWATV